MILQEALQKMDLEKYKKVMENWHVDVNEMSLYLDFIQSLRETKVPKRNGTLSVELVVHEYDDEEDNWEDMDVLLKVDGDDEKYAIDFIPWEECLGYEVDEKSFETYGLEECLFAILYDMSFDGFDANIRQKEIDKMMNRVKEVESGINKDKAYTSLDEVFRAIDKGSDEQEDETESK